MGERDYTILCHRAIRSFVRPEEASCKEKGAHF